MDESFSTSDENDVFHTPNPKPKGRFRIDLYAKKRKLAVENCIQEKVDSNVKVKRLRSQVQHAKRKAENLKEELGDVLVSIPKKSKMVYIESSSDQENTDKLNLSRAQASRRRNSTITALKPIHCTSSNSNNNESVMDGMWATLVSGKSTAQLSQRHVIPKIIREKVVEYNNSESNITRSINLLYKGGILTKRKYKEIRKENFEFMQGVKIPKPVAYDRLQAFIKSINMGEVIDLQ
ncbi:hypothetical protein QZH41_011381, partial [Actinostola sp. cb2023]